MPLRAGIESRQNGSSRSCLVATSCGTGTNFGKSRQKGEGEGFSGEMGAKWAAGGGAGVPRRQGGWDVGVVVSAWGTVVKGKRPRSGVLEGVFAGERPRRSGGGGGNRTGCKSWFHLRAATPRARRPRRAAACPPVPPWRRLLPKTHFQDNGSPGARRGRPCSRIGRVFPRPSSQGARSAAWCSSACQPSRPLRQGPRRRA